MQTVVVATVVLKAFSRYETSIDGPLTPHQIKKITIEKLKKVKVGNTLSLLMPKQKQFLLSTKERELGLVNILLGKLSIITGEKKIL